MIFKNREILAWAGLAVVPFLVATVISLFQRYRIPHRLPASNRFASIGETAAPREPNQSPRQPRRRSWRRWIFVGSSYEVLLTVIALQYYLNPDVEEWRIRRELVRSGVAQPIDIEWSGRDAVLTGAIATRRLSIKASQAAVAIAGSGHVTNRLRIEVPESVGSNTEELGQIEVSIDTSYDDSDDSLREIDAILSLPQFETIQVSRGLTLPDLIARRYGVVSWRLPRSFSEVAAAVRRLNGLNGTQNIRPGELKLPVLPSRYPVRHPSAVRKARIQEPGFMDLVTSELTGALQGVRVSNSFRRVRSSRVVITVPFTRGTAEQTQRVPEAFLLRSKIRITFGSGGGTNGTGKLHQVLSGDHDTDRDAIVNALKMQKQRSATVFVLDAGWPDWDDYKNSLAELRNLVDRANDHYGLAAVNWERPMEKAEFDKIAPPEHCVEIQRSLQEFNDLDKNHAIKVIYVPLSRMQNDDQILLEILKVSMFRHKAGTRSLITEEDRAAYRKEAEEFAARVLRQLNPTELAMPDAPGLGGSELTYQKTWETDSSIVTAVWYLADLQSLRDSSVYFLNESWTVLKDRVHLEAPTESFGIVVAAVGDDETIEADGDNGGVDFARLARPATNVLAAIEAKAGSDQAECKSSKVVEDYLDKTMAAAFDGIVTDGDRGICGSSFSAPRIAWILALSEEIRTDQSRGDGRVWADSVQQRLVSAREQSPSHQWKKLYLHPLKILR